MKDIRPIQQMFQKDGFLFYQCKFCSETAKSGSAELRLWEMFHLHFKDAEIKVLLCKKCKDTSPHDIFKKLNEVGAALPSRGE